MPRTSIEHKIDLKVKLLPWQHHRRRHFEYYLRYITDAKFEQDHSNISRDILDFVIYLLYWNDLWRHQFLNKNLNISGTREGIQNKKTSFLFSLKGLSNKHKLFFYFIGTLACLKRKFFVQFQMNSFLNINYWRKHIPRPDAKMADILIFFCLDSN